MTTTAALLCGCADKPYQSLGMCDMHYSRERRRAIKAGEWHPEERVPVAEVQKYIADLLEQGASQRGIARASGLAKRHIDKIVHGEYVTVLRSTARKIERLSIEDIDIQTPVDAVGVTRRLQALNALGYDLEDLAARIGTQRERISALCNGRLARVRPDLGRRIVAVYEELEMTPGPSELARRAAARKGYAVPLLWNEGEIDDPKARPSKYAWERYRGGHKVVRSAS